MSKWLSGRFLMVVGFTGAYCLTIIGAIICVSTGKMAVEVFMGIFTAFSTLVGIIVESYFKREDRKPKDNKGA